MGLTARPGAENPRLGRGPLAPCGKWQGSDRVERAVHTQASADLLPPAARRTRIVVATFALRLNGGLVTQASHQMCLAGPESAPRRWGMKLDIEMPSPARAGSNFGKPTALVARRGTAQPQRTPVHDQETLGGPGVVLWCAEGVLGRRRNVPCPIVRNNRLTRSGGGSIPMFA